MLYAAEGKQQAMGTDVIPSGQTPGDCPLSAEQITALNALTSEAATSTSSHRLNSGIGDLQAPLVKPPNDVEQAPPSQTFQVALLPPPYADADPFSDETPPTVTTGGAPPRGTVAEKEALRRQYAHADAAAQGGSTSLARVRAKYAFTGTEAGDLSFAEGEIIDVHGAEGEQWYCFLADVASTSQLHWLFIVLVPPVFPTIYVSPI